MSADSPKLAEPRAADAAAESGTSDVEVAPIAGRYRVQGVLGTGGMACVYRATDTATGRELAVKRLTLQRTNKGFTEAAALFEREFHTLVALSHPSVVAVYDYGVDALGPFYTMELLDGGDLKEKSPCDWRVVCAIVSEVCSALALVHSRRLTHGDVSPRNIRCTRDGHAKLIDFGALMPMGRCDKIVGTPAFVAPEVVSRLALDARTDLYSLGASLYYGLTGQLPYPVSDFRSLARAWQRQPPAPSYFVAEIPPALDALVLSLLELEPSQRPRSSFEVMQRLAAIAGLAQPEQLEVAQAYLFTPALIGRERELEQLRARLQRALAADGGGVLISGPSGVGRSRMLDAAVTLAKTMGAVVLRVGEHRGSPLSAAPALLEQLLESFPERTPQLLLAQPALAPLWDELGLRPLPDSVRKLEVERTPEAVRRARAGIQLAISELLTQVAAEQLVVIAADDIGRIDDASRGLLAGLAHGAQNGRQRLLLLAAEETPIADDQDSPAYEMLHRICTRLQLSALSLDQTAALLGSVFGDVPNLALLGARVFEHAQGNPRATLDLLQYLLDEKLIRYARGGWTLPSVLSEERLPRSTTAMLRARIDKLPPLCRQLLLVHALAPHALLSRAELGMMLGAADEHAHRALDSALYELLAQQLLSSDGKAYALAHRAAGALAQSLASEADCLAAHAQLAALYRRRGGLPIMVAKHALAAGEREPALAELMAFLREAPESASLVTAAQERPDDVAQVLARALLVAAELGRPVRELCELRHWLLMISVIVDPDYYTLVAPDFRRTLEQDAGLTDYFELARDPALDPNQRLMQALTRANERHQRASEQARSYPPDEAIKLLVRYVIISIAIGTKTNDGTLVASLPGLLEPFVAFSPLIDAVWHNSIALRETLLELRYMQARARWQGVLERLPSEGSGELFYVQHIRRAIAYGLGMLDARFGLPSASAWAAELEREPLHAVSALYLRKIICLQQGDLEGAERWRKQAELLLVNNVSEQMFSSSLVVELVAHAMSRDVHGVKELRDRIAPAAQRHEGWRTTGYLAEALFQRLVGEPELALAAFERCLQVDDLARGFGKQALLAWPAACAGYIETLVDLERATEALTHGERALAECRARDIDVAAHPIVRSVALAEAKIGLSSKAAQGELLTRALERLDGLIETQCALGMKGLILAASYEARARIAGFMHDRAAFTRFAQLSAAEYAKGQGSALSARYAALMVEPQAHAEGHVGATEIMSTVHLRSTDVRGSSLERELLGTGSIEQRQLRALSLLCELYCAPAGQLFLLRESRLIHAASSGEHVFAPELAARVQAYLARAQEDAQDDAMTTQALDDDEASEALAAMDGERMALLTGNAGEGADQVLGVLVLAPASEQPDLARVLRMSHAIGSALLRASGAQAVRTGRANGDDDAP